MFRFNQFVNENFNDTINGAELICSNDSWLLYCIHSYSAYQKICNDSRSIYYDNKGRAQFNKDLEDYTIYLLINTYPTIDDNTLVHIYVDMHDNICAYNSLNQPIDVYNILKLCGLRNCVNLLKYNNEK